MNNIFRIQLLALTIAISFYATYAFASSNSDMPSIGGEGASAISVLDLKSHYRGCRYASETIKLLPQKPDDILLAEIFEQIARLGMVHPVFQPVATT